MIEANFPQRPRLADFGLRSLARSVCDDFKRFLMDAAGSSAMVVVKSKACQ